MLKQTIEKLSDSAVINELVSGLNNINLEVVFSTVVNLNRMLKPYELISSHYEISNLIPEILLTIKNLAGNGVIDKLLFYLNYDFSLLNAKFVYSILKIFKRLLNISLYILELHIFSRANDLNLTKNLDNDIAHLKDFVDSVLVSKIIGKLNIMFEVENTKVVNAAFALALQISKKSIQQMTIILTETNFFNALLTKIETIFTFKDLPMYNMMESYISEMRKCIFYCIHITQNICTIKDNYSTYYSTLSFALNKMLVVAENLKEFFYTADAIFQYYYLILVGFLTRKTNFEDKFFVFKAQEAVAKNLGVLIRPFIFYIKNCLLSKFKKDALLVLNEAKTIEFFQKIVEANLNDEFLASEFIEVMEIIVEEQRANLITSTMLSDILYTFQKMLRFCNYYIVRKVMILLKNLALLKEPLVENLVFDCDILNNVFNSVHKFKTSDNFFYELYGTGKVTYDTIFLEAVMVFLLHSINSEVIKSNPKYFKSFNMENLSKLVSLYNLISSLSGDLDKVDTVTQVDCEVFEKFKDLPQINLLKNIIIFLDECLELSKQVQKKITNYPQLCSENLHLDTLISSLEGIVSVLDEKFQKFSDGVNAAEEVPENVFDVLYIQTQSKSEEEKNLSTTFTFANNGIVFKDIAAFIEKHYDSELNFYFINEETNQRTRIKNNDDFIEILDQIALEIREFKRTCLSMKLFVDDEARNKFKYLQTCVNCGLRYEPDDTSKANVNSSGQSLCSSCKDLILNTIVSKISRTSPYKNVGTCAQTNYNYK